MSLRATSGDPQLKSVPELAGKSDKGAAILSRTLLAMVKQSQLKRARILVAEIISASCTE